MRRRSVSCSRWARAGLDRREGLNLSHREFSAVLGEERDCSRPVLKRSHHISTGPQDLFVVIR